MTWVKYAKVPCPSCKAPAGAKCVSRGGNLQETVHVKRIRAWKSYERALQADWKLRT